MIELNMFKKLMEENNNRLPLLTLDEFFEGNTAEDSIAPNDCDFGCPSIAEIWELMRELEKRPDVAWIRIELHNDTEIAEYKWKRGIGACGNAYGCASLGEVYGAYHRKVQQDLPHPDAKSNPSCMQTYLLL